jgi:hypothetical protein
MPKRRNALGSDTIKKLAGRGSAKRVAKRRHCKKCKTKAQSLFAKRAKKISRIIRRRGLKGREAVSSARKELWAKIKGNGRTRNYGSYGKRKKRTRLHGVNPDSIDFEYSTPAPKLARRRNRRNSLDFSAGPGYGKPYA